MKVSPVHMDEKVHELIDIYLYDIQNNDFVLFFTELRNEIELGADDYIKKAYDYNCHRCFTSEMKLAFSDIQSGYKSVMRNYIEIHSIELEKKDVNLKNVDIDISIPRSSIYTITGGTVVAIALSFAADIWLGIIAEIVALCLAYKFYSDTREKARAIKMKQVLQDKKEQLAQQLISDINNWFEMLAAHSDTIIEDFFKKI